MVFVPVAVAGVVLAAIVFWLFYEATDAIGVGTAQGISAWFAQLPFPLSLAAKIVEVGTQVWTNAIRSFLSSQIEDRTRPITDAMNTQANLNRFNAYSQRNVSAQIINQLNAVTSAQQVQITQPIAAYVDNRIEAVEAREDTAVSDAYKNSTDYSDTLYRTLADWANGAFQGIYNEVQGEDGRVTQVAQSLESEIQGVQTNAFNAIATTQQQDVAYTDQRVEQTRGELQDVISATGEQQTKYTQDTRDYILDTFDQRITPTEQTVAGIETYLGTVVATAIAAETQWRNDCGDPLCSGVLGLAKGMSGFLRMAELGAIITLIVAAAEAPEDGAQVIDDAFGSLITGPINVFRSLTGS